MYKKDFDKSDKVLKERLASAVYLQVSTISQALIFVTRSRGWSYFERPGLLLVSAFIIAQLVHTFRLTIVTLQLRPFQYMLTYEMFPLTFDFYVDCYSTICHCKLEICWHPKYWLGMDPYHLALQYIDLLAS